MNIKNLKVNSKLVASIALTIGLIGCNPKSDCHIKEYHLHRYENRGITRYMDDEHLEHDHYTWTDDFKYDDKHNKDLHEFEMKNDLLKISDNEKYLKSVQNRNQDHLEYRYYNCFMKDIPQSSSSSFKNAKDIYVPFISYNWTADEEFPNLTGEVRMCHSMYTAYKIVSDKNGNFRLVESPKVDDIFSIQDEYPYFKEDFVSVVDKDSKMVLNYDDIEERYFGEEDIAFQYGKSFLNSSNIEGRYSAKNEETDHQYIR